MSNKTQKRPDDATESAPKKAPFLGIIIIVFGIFLVVCGVVSLTDNRQFFYAPDGRISVEIADSNEERQRGLSKRESLSEKEGMLFIFEEPGRHCFWMKDMQFAIDIVWLDTQKKVVHLMEAVTPESYPDTFCPPVAARYVLEVPQNQASALGIVKDITVRF